MSGHTSQFYTKKSAVPAFFFQAKAYRKTVKVTSASPDMESTDCNSRPEALPRALGSRHLFCQSKQLPAGKTVAPGGNFTAFKG